MFSGTQTRTAQDPNDKSFSQSEQKRLSTSATGVADHPAKCAKNKSEEISKKRARKGPKIKFPRIVSNEIGNPHAHRKGRETRDSIRFR